MNENWIDQPIKTRTENTLDKHKLSVYLSHHLESLDISDELKIKQYPGGASNLTYLLRWNDSQCILRTSPIGANIKSAHDMNREYHVLSALDGHFQYSPKVYLYCDDNEIIGRPFYLMQKVDGIIARKSFPMPITADLANQLCKNLIDVHVALHEIDLNKSGLSNLGKADGYIQRQISGWNSRYKNAMIEDSKDASELMNWLSHHQPKDVETCFIHNDYKFDNVVLSANRPHEIISVLDWEMSTIGSPLMDLGCSLAYWIEKSDPPELQAIRMMPTHLDGMMSRDQIIDYYQQKRGIEINDFNYFCVFGLFRLAVIVQQIYKRYAKGQTSNPAFAQFGHIAKILINSAENKIA